jgi:hypothetical protein
MDYTNIYTKLVNRGQHRDLHPPFETHHILPKCLGGDDASTNLVRLTPEEHYTAHQLLAKIYPENKKLWFAAHMMTVGLPKSRRNKAYGWVKRKLSASMQGAGNHMYGRKLTDERKQKSARVGTKNAMFGKHHSDATKKKISEKNKGGPGLVGDANGMFGKHHSDESKEKISQNNPWTGTAGKSIHPNKGRKLTELQKDHLRKIFTGVKLSNERIQKLRIPKGPQLVVTCPHCGKTGGVSNLTRYHFDNCKGKK